MGSGFRFRVSLQRVAGWALVAVGGVTLVAGAFQVADARYLVDQLSFLMSGGIAGLACVILGAALLLAAALHDDWRKMDDIEVILRDRVGLHLVDTDLAGGEEADLNLAEGSGPNGKDPEPESPRESRPAASQGATGRART